jgi:hypothetical protein
MVMRMRRGGRRETMGNVFQRPAFARRAGVRVNFGWREGMLE